MFSKDKLSMSFSTVAAGVSSTAPTRLRRQERRLRGSRKQRPSRHRPRWAHTQKCQKVEVVGSFPGMPGDGCGPGAQARHEFCSGSLGYIFLGTKSLQPCFLLRRPAIRETRVTLRETMGQQSQGCTLPLASQTFPPPPQQQTHCNCQYFQEPSQPVFRSPHFPPC